jgi:hypothetical protein
MDEGYGGPMLELRRRGHPEPRNYAMTRNVGPLLFILESINVRVEDEIVYQSAAPEETHESYLQFSGQVAFEPKEGLLLHGVGVAELRADNGIDFSAKLSETAPEEADPDEAAATMNDPRCRHLVTSKTTPFFPFAFSVPLKPEEMPGRFDRIRFYYFAQVREEFRTVKIKDIRQPGTADLGNGARIEWTLKLPQGLTTLEYSLRQEGGPTSADKQFEMVAFDGADRELYSSRRGMRIRDGVSSGKLTFQGPMPTSLQVRVMTDPKSYAGFIDYEKLLVPQLPPVK